MDKVKAIRINRPELWKRLLKEHSDNLCIDDKGLSISKQWQYELSDEISTGLEDMRDLALDECQNIYVVDGKARIYKYDRNSLRATEILSCDGSLPLVPRSPVGIALDRDTLYVADSQGVPTPVIIAYSRMNLQLKWVSYLTGFKSIRDITTGRNGNLYVLTEKAVLVLNRGGEMVKTLTPEVLYSMKDPSDIAVSRDGKIYVLDRELETEGAKLWLVIHTFEPIDGYQQIRILTGFKKEDNFIPSGLSLSGDGKIFIGTYKAPEEFITLYKVDMKKTPVLVPLWIYRDTARRLINDAEDNIYIINGSGDKLSLLKYREVIKGSEGNFTATYISKVIDSHHDGNVWHRFRIEGSFPEGTRVKFYYYISDDRDDTSPQGGWIDALPSDASAQGRAKREGLFISNNKGRYLRFRIELRGTEEKSPLVSSVSLFFPRYAYMDMLPALYREDPSGAEFLERFLSIFECLFYDTDYEIAHISRYMDVLGAPEEFLEWLSRWLSLKLHSVLTEEQKRTLLLKAPELYKMRGTRRGIEEIVEIVTGKKPFVVENIFLSTDHRDSKLDKGQIKWCQAQEDVIFGPSSETTHTCDGEEINLIERLYGSDPFSFCVFLKEKISSPLMSALKDILDDFKPAHTRAGVMVLEPWFYLDGHTYLGINTVLNRGYFVIEKSRLGRDTTLTDMEECAQVGRKSRIEIDFRII